MPCVSKLTDFARPIKFAGFPLWVTIADDTVVNNEHLRHEAITDAAAQAAPLVYDFKNCSARYPIQLKWKNLQGGYDYYVFDGKHEYSLETSGGVVAANADFVPYYVNRGDVVELVKVKTGKIDSRAEYDSVFHVLYSKQVWQVVKAGDTFRYVSVKVKEGSYRRYQVDDRFYTLEFVIEYPPIAIQQL